MDKIHKILIIIFIFSVFIVSVLIILLFSKRITPLTILNRNQQQGSITNTPSYNENNSASPTPRKNYEGKIIKTTKEMYVENSIDNPFNELTFERIKMQFPPTRQVTLERLFHGQILEITSNVNGPVFKIKSLEPNGLNQTVWYGFNTSILDKITVTTADDLPISFSSLKKDDTLEIYENNDFTKDYLQSIISIKIVKK